MAINLTEHTKPDDLYICENGGIHRVVSICRDPTITVENVTSGQTTFGGVGCMNLDPFTAIEDLTREELLVVVENLATDCKQNLEGRLKLKEQIFRLKEKIFKLKFPEAEG